MHNLSSVRTRNARACAPWLALLIGCSAAPTDDLPAETGEALLPQEAPEADAAAPRAPAACTTPPASTSRDACNAPIRPGDDRLCTYAFGGRQREYYIYAPPSFDPCKPASLIVDAHGASESIEVHVGKEAFNANRPKGYGSGWRRADLTVALRRGLALRATRWQTSRQLWEA